MQKAENVNCTLNLPAKARWASMVTSLESVKEKQSSAAQNCCFRKVFQKSSNLSEEVRRTLLNETFWHESEAIVSLLKPLQSAITQQEEDSPNLADICRLNFRYEILKSTDSFFFTLLEQEEMKSINVIREDFCINIFHEAAYF